MLAERSPYHSLSEIHSFGVRLEPRYIFRRRITRPVSYYALFKGWLLLSQPSWLSQ